MAQTLGEEARLVLTRAGIKANSKIVLGVSGGPDSLALLHLLKGIMVPECLVVGHLNHRLREEADEEAAFVASTAESWGIPFRLDEVDVAKLSERRSMTVEEAARHARYSFLIELAEEIGAKYVVVAHNADDQVETVFLNLLRGTGLSGLRGMETVRQSHDNPDILIVRPFLYTPRQAIEAYCEEQNLRPMLDSSNWDPTYRRNYLRHDLLPRLKDVNPQFNRHMQQLAELVKGDEAFLEQQTKKAWKEIVREQGPDWLVLDKLKWKALPLSLRRRTIRYAVRTLRSSANDISFRTVEQAQQVAWKGATGSEAALPGKLILRVEYDVLKIRASLLNISPDLPQLLSDKVVKLPIPGSVSLAEGWTISSMISQQSLARIKQNLDPWCAYVDVRDAQELQVRSREPGERFQPLGLGSHSVSLQDHMVNLKLPAQLRSNWPVVVENDQPIWLVGYHIDERVKVTDSTNQIVQLICNKEEETNSQVP